MEKKRTKKEQRAASDKRIMQSAIKCFGENGYTNTTMAAIAKNAGVTAGLLVQRHESKEKLFCEAYRATVQETFSDEEEFVAVPMCLYNRIKDWKSIARKNPDKFHFLVMVYRSNDLPEQYNIEYQHMFESRQTYKALQEAQCLGIVGEGNLLAMFRAFSLQVINQIDISEHFQIPHPEDEYFLKVFKIPDEELVKEEKRKKAILNTVCQLFNALAYIYVNENITDELIIIEKTQAICNRKAARETFQKLVERFFVLEDQEGMKQFLDFDTIDERIGVRNSIARTAKGTDGQIKLVVMNVAKRDVDGKITEIVVGYLDLETEKA